MTRQGESYQRLCCPVIIKARIIIAGINRKDQQQKYKNIQTGHGIRQTGRRDKNINSRMKSSCAFSSKFANMETRIKRETVQT